MFFFASLSILDNRARHFSHQKKPRPLFPKGRGIRSCYHLMFPKRSHAPAHGVLIIKDPGISNGCQFRHSLLTFSGYLRSRFRCAAPGCIQKKKMSVGPAFGAILKAKTAALERLVLELTSTRSSSSDTSDSVCCGSKPSIVRAPLIHRQLSVRSRSDSYLFPSLLFHYIPPALTRLYGSLYGDSGALSRAEALKFVNFISFPAIFP